ncbi:spore coat protein A [Skermanella aerolata]|uniref:Spore coat protein A n=2 Tax=Skermanella aerolata TaxID=393310 RepID=A0A512E444_9PROT|nr:spore coat protein A [Skermanella aerolata]
MLLRNVGNEKQQERARLNRMEIIDAKLSRRDLIRYGLLAAGGMLVAKSGLSIRASGAATLVSPRTTPWAEPLPIPQPLQPNTSFDLSKLSAGLNGDSSEAPRASHQLWDYYKPRKFYEIEEKQRTWSFHKDLPTQPIWNFQGDSDDSAHYAEPTLHARYGEPIVVRNKNNLPANHKGYGIPDTSTHLHNAHNASESDGNPSDYYGSGYYKDFHYCNKLANDDPNEALGFLWFHDHRLDYTAQNVYRGLVGTYILYDELDCNDETNVNGFRLPSGEYDVPLVFGDKVFNSNGIAYYDLFALDGIIGDKQTVNGKIQPFFDVKKRRYRLRLLNTGPSRFLSFKFSNNMPFWQISNDGNLLPKPIKRTSINLTVAERVDIIVDFNSATGSDVFLMNVLEHIDGTGPTGKILNPGTPLLKFNLGPTAADGSINPDQIDKLRGLPVMDTVINKTRTWIFNRQNGAWSVNGQLFNRNIVNAKCKLGTAEIWNFENGGGGWSHPIHMHYEEFRILSRNGVAVKPGDVEYARKDVIWLHPGEKVKVYVKFRDFTGKYPLHCHNVVHEDHAMMARYDIVDGPAS